MSNKSILLSVVLLSVALSACSSNPQHRRQIDGSFSYLDAPELKSLTAPAGITLPPVSPQFRVAVAQNQQAPVGKALDIRVPSQPLAQVDGSAVAYRNGVALMNLPASNSNWQRIKDALALQQIGINNEKGLSLTTQPYQLPYGDNTPNYAATYQVQLQSNGTGQNLIVRLLTLTDGQKAITDSNDIQRYTIDFFNMLSSSLGAKPQVAQP